MNISEDPVHIFDHEPAPAHSVLKLMIDVFSRKKTAEHFYTNDVKVAIDIIVRQLADLSPGDSVSNMMLLDFWWPDTSDSIESTAGAVGGQLAAV